MNQNNERTSRTDTIKTIRYGQQTDKTVRDLSMRLRLPQSHILRRAVVEGLKKFSDVRLPGNE